MVGRAQIGEAGWVIPLTQGKVALVDEADFPALTKWRWFAVHVKDRWYAVRNVGEAPHQRQIRMHAQILGCKGVDHLSGDGLDNRRGNLRAAGQSQNTMNARKRRHHRGQPTSSRFKGVSRHRVTGKWAAYVSIDGKQTHLGLFAEEINAALAYNEAARNHYGEFAHLNDGVG